MIQGKPDLNLFTGIIPRLDIRIEIMPDGVIRLVIQIRRRLIVWDRE